MHNIQTSGQASDYRTYGSHTPQVDARDYWLNPVLTVRGGSAYSRDSEVPEANLLFHATEGLVINPWVEPVYIKGEDLFALRELLAELPEDLFKRPADPVDPNVGLTLLDEEGDWWVYQPGGWNIVDRTDGELTESTVYTTFDAWSDIVFFHGIDSRPSLPRWTDGDIIGARGSRCSSDVIWVRSKGVWNMAANQTGSTDVSDETMSMCIDSTGSYSGRVDWFVIRQQNA